MSKKSLFTGLLISIFISATGLLTAEYYTSRPSFCGSCHIMKSYYKSWEKSIHGEKDVACVDCHYAPGEQSTLKAKFKGLGQLFSYLSEEGKEVRKAAIVSDASCMTSACHPQETFYSKKVKFTEQVPFVHKTHADKTIEGQVLHCDTCHQHVRRHVSLVRSSSRIHLRGRKAGLRRPSVMAAVPAMPSVRPTPSL